MKPLTDKADTTNAAEPFFGSTWAADASMAKAKLQAIDHKIAELNKQRRFWWSLHDMARGFAEESTDE